MSDAHANGYAKNESVAFEHSDVDTRVLLYFVAGLGVSLVGVMAVIWFLFVQLQATDVRDKRSTHQLAERYRESRPNVEDRLPSGPRLEGLAVDMPGGHTIGRMQPSTAAIQAKAELAALANGGWVKPGELARIPIRDVIQRLSKPGSTPTPTFEQLPSGTSSGRTPIGGATP